VVAALLILGGCGSLPPGIPVEGVLGNHSIRTEVDSPHAAQYLTTGALASVPACSDTAVRRESLAELSTLTSVDTAAIFAARCLLARNEAINGAYARAEAEIRATPPERRGAAIAALAGYALLFVPGWDYQTAGEDSGADFARPRALFSRLGVPNVLAPLDENGSVEENALTIEAALDGLGTGRPVIIVSVSSGGPAVAHALGRPGARASPQVAGWLNIGGILHGVPYLDAHRDDSTRLGIVSLAKLKGWNIASIDSMNAANSIARMQATRLPPHLAVLNVIGIPLSHEVTRRARFFYTRLLEFGPNDGFTLIPDAIAPGGDTVVMAGHDHFLVQEPEELEIKTLAMTRTLLSVIAAKRGGALQ
jgi:hypothetical protein